MQNKIYNTQSEIDADIKNGLLKYDGDIIINFDNANINGDIQVENITAKNITTRNINARNIKAENIDARDINAWNIDVQDIDARDINAENIKANNIIYRAVCFAYNTFICNSIKGKRDNHKHFCLDSEIIIKGE